MDAVTPTRKHPTDAGMDVYALNDVIVKAHSFKIVKTGICFKVPTGCMLLVMPKSRNDWLIGAGVIDQDYTGEVLIKIVNISNENIAILKGDAVAQVVIVPVRYFIPSQMSLETIFADYDGVTGQKRATTGGIVSQLELFDEKPDF